jgi:CBS domain containing-hemolysin-like protein
LRFFVSFWVRYNRDRVNDSLFRIVIVLLIVVVNGYFAGAEVALLSVRQSRLRQMAEEGHAGAQAALSLLSNPGRLLSVVQVGVTLASLGLGWAGEETVFKLLTAAFHPVTTPVTEKYLHGFSFVFAFLVISYFHIVVGEVLPKNLAIAKADRLAVIVAPALLVFYRISIAFVVVIEKSSDVLMRALKIPSGVHGGGHSAEELKVIVRSSGGLTERQEAMIGRVLDLENVLVREIMVPRNDIVSIAAGATLDDVIQTMLREQHSRLPVYDGAPEKIIGYLHYKDLLPVWEERRKAIRSGRPSRSFRVTRLLRPLVVVPETKPLAQMFEEFRHGRSHIAMVVDEFGTIAGLVTVEDCLEQVVGPIADEHDEKIGRRAPESDELELDGATRILELEADFGLEFPADGAFETLAGFVLYRLGAIPRVGQFVEYQGRRFTVLHMDRNRIARVRIEKLPEVPASTPR